jgi:hypothetical protein
VTRFNFQETCWTLVRLFSEKSAQVRLLGIDNGTAVPVFNDETLARTYGEDSLAIGYEPVPIDGPRGFLTFLLAQQSLGVTHVALNPVHEDAPQEMTRIEVAIDEVRSQIVDS